MVRSIKISVQLLALILTGIAAAFVMGLTGFFSLQQAGRSLIKLDQLVAEQAVMSDMRDILQSGLSATMNDIFTGATTWEDAQKKLNDGEIRFGTLAQELGKMIDEGTLGTVGERAKLDQELAGVRTAYAELGQIIEARDRNRVFLFFTNDFSDLVTPLSDHLTARQILVTAASKQELAVAERNDRQFLQASVLLTTLVIGIVSALGFLIYRFISYRVRRIADTVQRVSQGDFQARTGVSSADELGMLAQAFDKLLQERVAALAQSERENEALNTSIINLLQAVSQLSQRDLTVKVPVSEDVTGTLADALNLLTNEMAKVLQNVTKFSADVAQASNTVKSQADTVMGVASSERELVLQTSVDLARTADAMNEIAKLAQASNEAAERAIQTTQAALETVNSTMVGINSTRDTIRETEKRIKRLGERSQEINAVVNLINNIAERTHILALNASMHAASAGEAGRGFAVVANEVQHLAENAREATSEIAKLVNNIQVETADTVTAMNAAISQVVDDSRLAEQAGERMKLTQQSTADLVATVQRIAAESRAQANASNELRSRASEIEKSTERTSNELEQQTQQTNHLLTYARNLVDAVQVFRLPGSERPAEERPTLKVA